MSGETIYTVTLNPAWDRTAEVERLQPGGTHLLGAVRGDAGGKGINVSRVLCALGQPTCALGLLGGGAGDELDQALRQEGVPAAFVRLAAACRVNTKIVDRAAGVTTEFNEMGPRVDDGALEQLEARLKGLPQGAVTVLAGSLPPGAPARWYARAAELCHDRGGRVVLDASREALRLGLEGEPEIVKPNRDELACLCGGASLREEQLPAGGAGAAAGPHPPGRGSAWGLMGRFSSPTSLRCRVKAPRVRAVSTVGAGDTMTAVLARLAGLPATALGTAGGRNPLGAGAAGGGRGHCQGAAPRHPAPADAGDRLPAAGGPGLDAPLREAPLQRRWIP